MGLGKLYLEGKLDSKIFTPLFSGSVTIEKGVSKTSIRPQAGGHCMEETANAN